VLVAVGPGIALGAATGRATVGGARGARLGAGEGKMAIGAATVKVGVGATIEAARYDEQPASSAIVNTASPPSPRFRERLAFDAVLMYNLLQACL
jgi:hypothetical protein